MVEPTLRDIIDIDDLREMMCFFHEAVGLSVGILDADNHWLISLGWQDICTEFHRGRQETRNKCLLCEARIQEYLTDNEYLSYPCPNGLMETAIPILLNEQPIGYFFLGQFLHEQPDLDFFRRQAIANGFNVASYMAAVARVPVVSRQRIDDLMRFFIRFFGLLTRIGAENQQRRLAELKIQEAKEQLEVRVHERTRELNDALLEVGDLAAQLSETLQQVEHLAVTDILTDTYNRRKFDEAIRYEQQRTREGHQPFSLIMYDIDYFKKVNDRFGHSCGDLVLKRLCRLIRGLVRQGDLLIRWGGEEFFILLPGTLLNEAGQLAERIRQEVAVEAFPQAGSITISLGVAQLRDGDSIDSLLKRVDDALYQAKQNGRNQVFLGSELLATGDC